MCSSHYQEIYAQTFFLGNILNTYKDISISAIR